MSEKIPLVKRHKPSIFNNKRPRKEKTLMASKKLYQLYNNYYKQTEDEEINVLT